MGINVGGYMGQLLKVDLSSGILKNEPLKQEYLRQYIGGTGLAARYLWDEVADGVKPLDAENRLIFMTGPFTGTRAPGSGTYAVATKGTLTGFGTASQANGYFGARLKFAGFDGIILHGISSKWVYLYLHDGVAEIRDASHLMGKDTFETQEILKAELGGKDVSVASIGPAGENLVRFACICNDSGHIASTNGVGTVMGSKKVKAIAVKGTMKVPLNDDNKAEEAFKKWRESAKGCAQDLYGTLGFFNAANTVGFLPVKNLTTDTFPEAPRFGTFMRSTYRTKRNPCHACTIGHGREIEFVAGPYAGLKTEEPEFEDQAGWGPNVGVSDPAAATKITDFNDRLGMDLKEATFVVSMALECYEKSIISPEEVDGINLVWGNAEAIMELMRKIAYREGLGNILAEGVKRAAETIGKGATEFGVWVKNGIAPHVMDVRGTWGQILTQTVSDTGSFQGIGIDFRSYPDVGIDSPARKFNAEDIVRNQVATAPKRQLDDSLGICSFFMTGNNLSIVVEALNAITGMDFTPEETLKVGLRVTNLQRAFNLLQGMTPADEKVSPRILQAPVDGPAQGVTIEPHLDWMIHEYYRRMGWDENTSKPLPETLNQLGLNDMNLKLC